MSSVKSILMSGLFFLSLNLSGCGGISDDLAPSGTDKRPDVEAGSIGTQVSQQSPDWSLYDTLGNSRGLYDELSGAAGVVLYFTMWCPVCEYHMQDMRVEVIPDFPAVKFFLVDYVSGTIINSRHTQEDLNYTDIETLVDANQTVFDLYQASMGTTVVIDKNGIVRMNEDYKDGVKLTETLLVLP